MRQLEGQQFGNGETGTERQGGRSFLRVTGDSHGLHRTCVTITSDHTQKSTACTGLCESNSQKDLSVWSSNMRMLTGFNADLLLIKTHNARREWW